MITNIDIYNLIYEDHCEECDGDTCASCHVQKILNVLSGEGQEKENVERVNGCPYCRDKRGNIKSFFIMTDANKTIPEEEVNFCPVCGGRMTDGRTNDESRDC